MSYKLLIINPGSTSTKIGVYEDEKELFEETLRHTNEEIKRYDTIYDQFGFRKELILNILKEKNFDIKINEENAQKSLEDAFCQRQMNFLNNIEIHRVMQIKKFESKEVAEDFLKKIESKNE